MDAVPGLGQHTEQLLRELGLGADRIGEMRAAGAI
jgi:itaconate CoA-transferase